MPTPEVTHLPSIQGERLTPETVQFASMDDVDAYVDSHSEEALDCRTDNHSFPKPRRGVIAEFTGLDEDDNLIAEYQCRSCKCAYRIETWATVGRGRSARYELLSATVIYRKGPNGEVYLNPPGVGRMKRSQIRSSRMTAVMKSQGQSPAAIRKQLRRNQRR